MKKITQEEFEQTPVTGRGGRSPVFRALLDLAVGEGIELSAGEWTKSYPPTRIAKAIGTKYKRTYRGGRNGATGGWSLLRVS